MSPARHGSSQLQLGDECDAGPVPLPACLIHLTSSIFLSLFSLHLPDLSPPPALDIPVSGISSPSLHPNIDLPPCSRPPLSLPGAGEDLLDVHQIERHDRRQHPLSMDSSRRGGKQIVDSNYRANTNLKLKI